MNTPIIENIDENYYKIENSNHGNNRDENDEDTESKRRKTDNVREENNKDMIFSLFFTRPNILKSMVDIGKDVFKELTFEICKTPEFSGINIKSIDTKQVCMINSRVECDVNINDECRECNKISFCIKLNTFHTCLKSFPCNHNIRLEMFKGSSDIFMRSFSSEALSNNTGEEIKLQIATLLDTQDSIGDIGMLDYEYFIDIELSAIKRVAKICKDFKAEDICFEIIEELDGETFFAIRASGDDVSNFEQRFASLGDSKRGITNDKKSTTCTPSKVICSEKYSTEYINMFLKSMDKNTISIKLSNNKPLLLNYMLDSEKSMICFILAPRCD